MTSASDMERARTAMMVAAGVVTSTGLLVLTQRSIRSTIASMLKVRISLRFANGDVSPRRPREPPSVPHMRFETFENAL